VLIVFSEMPSPPIPTRRRRPDGSLNMLGSRRRRGSQNPGSSSVGQDLNQLDMSGGEFKGFVGD
jgi:hypothetical protein